MNMESFGAANIQESGSREQELMLLLAKLPEELREKWQARADDLEIGKAIELIHGVLKSRDEAKEKIFTEIHEIESPELKEEVRSVIKAIETTFGDSNYFVGNGSVAEVYHMPYAPHVCVKYLVNPEKAREHGNNFREEKAYLEDMHRFSVDGIRVPDVYFYHMSDFGTCFGMENIDGLSLDRIMEKPESIDFLDVITSQKQEDVIRRMKNFIKEMHAQKKIVHRDLSPRNIMVDRGGNWYVIDYGRARRIEIGDDTTDVSESSDIAGAENAIRQLYAKLVDTSSKM
jgi:tRNA A-37 threonylcarbamoyl transferase component Bud32